MTDLFTATRPHDLPPRWDGYPVEWQGWQYGPPIFLCPRPKEKACCHRCASTSERPFNRGIVRTEAGRLVGNVLAFRCPDCRHDQACDGLSGGAWWDLDPDDYQDEGSYAGDRL